MCMGFGSGEPLLHFALTGNLIPQNYKPQLFNYFPSYEHFQTSQDAIKRLGLWSWLAPSLNSGAITAAPIPRAET